MKREIANNAPRQLEANGDGGESTLGRRGSGGAAAAGR